MPPKLKQTTLFASQTKVVPTVVKKQKPTDRPDWFDEDFWNALPEIERRIHCIAHRELASSYTVDSTQAYNWWKSAGKPKKWSTHDHHEWNDWKKAGGYGWPAQQWWIDAGKPKLRDLPGYDEWVSAGNPAKSIGHSEK